MQLTYVNTVKSLICAQLEDGETIPQDVKKPDKPVLAGPGTFFISVDGSREDYLALIKMDPTLESVVDPAAQPEVITKQIEAKNKKAAEDAAKAAAPAPEHVNKVTSPAAEHGKAHR